ncbi:ArsR/SmtB family transcription factor [Pseudokineococcus sp. 1T1Z-3]|uniref:ArsR/SmtB family transcription factor n=1 Tax=Pseudokineococcus sp. 1T1Z-3 TaxID=3132745 RepID=UPI0030B1059E
MSDHAHPVDADRVARARARVPSREDAVATAEVLTVIADPTRARVLQALDAVEELCVGDLALALGASEDAVGYALRVLRGAGLVTNRKAGRVVFYRLAANFPEPLAEHCLRALAALARDGGGPGR